MTYQVTVTFQAASGVMAQHSVYVDYQLIQIPLVGGVA